MVIQFIPPFTIEQSSMPDWKRYVETLATFSWESYLDKQNKPPAGMKWCSAKELFRLAANVTNKQHPAAINCLFINANKIGAKLHEAALAGSAAAAEALGDLAQTFTAHFQSVLNEREGIMENFLKENTHIPVLYSNNPLSNQHPPSSVTTKLGTEAEPKGGGDRTDTFGRFAWDLYRYLATRKELIPHLLNAYWDLPDFREELFSPLDRALMFLPPFTSDKDTDFENWRKESWSEWLGSLPIPRCEHYWQEWRDAAWAILLESYPEPAKSPDLKLLNDTPAARKRPSRFCSDLKFRIGDRFESFVGLHKG